MITETMPVEQTSEAANERYDLISQAIEEVRPYLRSDGGDCELVSVEGNLITVRLRGACIGCSLSGATVKGVEARLVSKLGFPLKVALAPPGPPRPPQMHRRA